MSNALKLVATDSLTVASHRPERIPSNRQQEIRANMALISRTWRTLTQAQRDGFAAFGQTWSPIKGKSTASGLTVFQSLNGVRLNSGQTTLLTDAPVQPPFIGKLPTFTLSAMLPGATGLTLTGGKDDAPQAIGFSLQIVSPPFTGPVVVLATRPLSAGTGQPSPRLFRQIATLPSLTSGSTDVADAYLTQFPIPASGMKVAVQIYPITPTGFRGSPFTQTATVL